MNEIEKREKLEEIRVIIEKEIEKNYSDLNILKTEPGLELQKGMINLTKFIMSLNNFTYTSRIGSNILEIYQINIDIESKKPIFIKDFAENNNLTIEEANAFLRVTSQYIEELKETSTKEFMDNNPYINPDFEILERSYTLFFTSLLTYIDLYTMKIFQLIIPNIHGKDLNDFQKDFNAYANPVSRLNAIKNCFSLFDKGKLKTIILYADQWETTFLKIKDLRDTIAHRNPLVTEETLSEYFPTMLTNTTKIINDSFSQANGNEQAIVEMIKPIVPGLAISLLFENIMKNCYAFLAIYDILLYQKLNQKME